MALLRTGLSPRGSATGPMADVVAFARPYADAAELLDDLSKLAGDFPTPADAWEKLVRTVSEATAETPLRKSA